MSLTQDEWSGDRARLVRFAVFHLIRSFLSAATVLGRLPYVLC
jgi:hypothetical protein